VLTIHDEPPPSVHFLSPEYRVRENGLRARITVVLDHPWNQPLQVGVATRQLAKRPRRGQATEGRDYVRLDEVQAFEPRQTAIDFFVTLKDDNLTEGDEALGLDLKDPATGRVLESARLIIVDARSPRHGRPPGKGARRGGHPRNHRQVAVPGIPGSSPAAGRLPDGRGPNPTITTPTAK
jgi:hypothetical protein